MLTVTVTIYSSFMLMKEYRPTPLMAADAARLLPSLRPPLNSEIPTLHRSLLFAPFVLASSYAFGQANAVDAAVNGYVTDSSKGAIAGAHISLTNVSTGIQQTTTADGNGYYRFPLVTVGTYRLETTATGFQPTTQTGIALNVGQEARIDVALPIGSASESVEVQASATLMDTGTSTVGACWIVTRLRTCRLPLAISSTFYCCHQALSGFRRVHFQLRSLRLAARSGRSGTWMVWTTRSMAATGRFGC